MNKHFKNVVTHGALGHKLSKQDTIADKETLVDLLVNSPELKTQFKNVCAPIHISMYDELTRVVSLLKVSKREFLTMAIESALDEAKAIIDEVNVDFKERSAIKLTVSEVIEKDGETFVKIDQAQPEPHWIEFVGEDAEKFIAGGFKPGDVLEKRGNEFVKTEGAL
jgi:hypothetical protein